MFPRLPRLAGSFLTLRVKCWFSLIEMPCWVIRDASPDASRYWTVLGSPLDERLNIVKNLIITMLY